MIKVTRITIFKGYEFSEIPDHPETTNIWNLDAEVCLWFTTYDARWRFMNIAMGVPARRSVESFATKQEAEAFYNSKRQPIWIREPLGKHPCDAVEQIRETQHLIRDAKRGDVIIQDEDPEAVGCEPQDDIEEELLAAEDGDDSFYGGQEEYE